MPPTTQRSTGCTAGGPFPGGVYLQAQPDGHVFIGGPAAGEQDLLHFRPGPDPELLYDGPEGVAFSPEERMTAGERIAFAEGILIGAMAAGLLFWYAIR